MDTNAFFIQYFVWGLCLGEAIHIMTYFWAKGVTWTVEALSGDIGK